MKHLQIVSQTVNAWQIRIVALAFIVLSVAGGSHMLVNAFAVSADMDTQSSYMTTNSSISIPMHSATEQYVIKHIPSKGSQPVGLSNR